MGKAHRFNGSLLCMERSDASRFFALTHPSHPLGRVFIFDQGSYIFTAEPTPECQKQSSQALNRQRLAEKGATDHEGVRGRSLAQWPPRILRFYFPNWARRLTKETTLSH